MKTPKKVLERRKSVRIPDALPFHIGHKGYGHQARTINISATGVLCSVDADIPMLTQLEIALSLPSGKQQAKSTVLNAKGVVVRKDKDPQSNLFYLAIYFSDIKVRDQKVLSEYIQARLNGSAL